MKLAKTLNLSNEKLIFLLLFSSFIFLYHEIRIGINVYDEGLSVYGAVRVLEGEIPYRDFWTIYSPGQFYTLALLFKVFGISLLPARIFSIVINFNIIILTYFLSKKLFSQNFAFLSWLLALFWLKSLRLFSSPISPSVMFSLLSCLCLIDFLSSNKGLKIIMAGIFTGLATLFRHDIGFYTFFSETILILFYGLRSFKNDKCLFKKFLKCLYIWNKYFCSTMMVLIPVASFFIYYTPLSQLFFDLIIFPAIIFPKFRSLPYPSIFPDLKYALNGEQTFFYFMKEILNRFLFYFPLFIFAISFLWIVFSIYRKRFSDSKWGFLLFIILGVMFFNTARVRSDVPHLFPMMIPAIILLSVILSEFIRKNDIKVRSLILPLLYIMTSLILLAFILKTFEFKISNENLISLELKRGKGIYLPRNQAHFLQKSIQYIQEHVSINEKIFVGNARHDRIFTNDIMFYFLAERKSATKYHELHPGLATTSHIQREIIRELEINGVRYIILWSGVENIKEPNESNISSGIFILDRFIKSYYQELVKFGPYTILKKIQ